MYLISYDQEQLIEHDKNKLLSFIDTLDKIHEILEYLYRYQIFPYFLKMLPFFPNLTKIYKMGKTRIKKLNVLRTIEEEEKADEIDTSFINSFFPNSASTFVEHLPDFFEDDFICENNLYEMEQEELEEKYKQQQKLKRSLKKRKSNKM